MHPLKEILEALGVQMVAPLGGRLNQHWLVRRRGEQLVLRCWSETSGDIDYELRLLARVAALGWPVSPAVADPLEYHGRAW